MDSRDRSVRHVAWRELFPCILLFRSLRASFRLSVLLAATGGYLLMLIGNWLLGGVLFAGTEDRFIEEWHREFLASVWDASQDSQTSDTADAEADLEPPEIAVDAPVSLLDAPARLMEAAVRAPATAWWHLTGPVVYLFDPHLSAAALGYLLLLNLWNVLVWSLFGGAICRMAAIGLTKCESRGLAGGVADAVARYPAHALAPLLAATAILLVALPLVLVGVLAQLNWIAWAAGMLWIAALIIGLVLAVLVVGLVVAWPLLWATIAVEQSDAFDAVSRMYAYVYQRPLRFFGYALIAAALAVIGSVSIHVLTEATVTLSDWAVAWGRGDATFSSHEAGNPPEASAALSGAAAGRSFWGRMASSVATAYSLGLLWCLAVGIYLLLRLHVDNAQTDEITDNELDTLQSLPHLRPHESGVPDITAPPRP